MSLLGCEWESIERHEKLRGVVSQREKSKPHFSYAAPVMTSEPGARRIVLDECYSPPRIRNYIFWPQLTKDNVQRSYLNFKEDE